jgi:PIN domain nuclease of toxin-antitoxin system
MLIDTNALIWYGLEPDRLSDRAAQLMREPRNFYSHVSLWEMAIKSGSGKLKLHAGSGQPSDAKQFMLRLIRELQLSALPLEFDDLADVEALPSHHKDPFDRLLVVQAKRRDLPIISADPIFERYGVKRVW